MSDIFVKFDGVDGEATDDQHKGWIRGLALTHQISQPHSTANSGGGSLGGISRSEHGDVVLSKYLDKSSPKLNLLCCNGKRVAKVEIDICRQVDSKLVYQHYELEGALVRSTSIHADGSGGDEKPREEIAVAYEKITMKYTEVDPKTNKANGDTMAFWDVLTNTGG